MPHLIVTGGTGYIGAALIRAALDHGWHVTALERSPKDPGAGFLARLPWKLGEPLPAALLERLPPADAVVHLAHEWDTPGTDDDPNVLGTGALLRSCVAAGLKRFIFVSSVSAREQALNVYGRLKWQLEQRVTAHGGVSARVGLVYGGPRRAQYGVLARLAGMRVLPMIDPHKEVQPIHLSEVCAGLLALAAAPALAHGVYVLAAPRPISFARYLRTLACALHQKPLLIVPIPAAVALLLCDVAGLVPFLPKVNRERILGLKGMRFVPSDEGLAEIGLAVHDMAPTLAGEAPVRRRALIGEGAILLRYVLGVDPTGRLLRHYVRALEAAGDIEPLALPPAARRWPSLLRAVEPLRGESALQRRLAIAIRLAETSAAGADRFFAYDGTRFGRLVRAGGEMALDLLALPFRLLRR